MDVQMEQTDTQHLSEKPLISFIITYYNKPLAFLKECIHSILALHLPSARREILVIDDGSDVSPINDLLEIRDQIIYLRQENLGLSAARNVGLRLASGQYIQFVDADDKLLVETYDRCIDFIQAHHPDIFFFDFANEDTVDESFIYDGPVSGTTFLHENNLHSSACGYLFSRNIVGDLQFPVGRLHEDEEFTPLLLLRADKVFKTDARPYFYRMCDGSIVHGKDPQHLSKRLEDIEHILSHLQGVAGTLPLNDRMALNRRIAQLSMEYLYHVICLTRSQQKLEETVERLRAQGLFPLPVRKYTRKYYVFSKVVNHKIGRKLLLAMAPVISIS